MDIVTSILLTVILSLISFCLYDWLFTSWDYWISRGIPSVPGHFPILGNSFSIFSLKRNIGLLCTHIYNKYNDKSMVGFYNLKNPVLIVRDPDLVKVVLQTSFNHFQYNQIQLDHDLDPLFGRDVLFARGEAWKKSRNNLLSLLTSKKLKDLIPAIVSICKNLENHVEEKRQGADCLELNAKSLFSRYTAEVAARAVLGVNGNSFSDNYKGTLLDNMKMTVGSTKLIGMKRNIIFFLPTLTKILGFKFTPANVDKYFRSVVNHLVDLREKDSIPRDSYTPDVLQLMLDKEKIGKSSRHETISQTFSFFLESFESSSVTLSSMSYLIGKHQDVQSRLRAEVEAVLAKHEDQLTYEGIKEMTYLDQVLNETLRLFPVTGTVVKECTMSCRLEGFDGLTVDVEPGTAILIPIWGLHRDPNYWDNPDEFNPERFSKENCAGRHKFIHLPFSGGPRTCPGRRFGIIEVKAAMATIVKKYRIELSPKLQEPLRIDPTHFLTIPIGGHWIILRPLKA